MNRSPLSFFVQSVRVSVLGLLLGAAALSARAAAPAQPFTVERVGDVVTVTWALEADPKYQEVMRDTDDNPAGRKRAGVVRGNLRTFTETLADGKPEYWYWIKVVTPDGKTSNLGPVKAVRKKQP